MDEIIDIVDKDTGLNIGKSISKNEAHRLGIWHKSIHLLIVSKDKKRILLQKRCKLKKFFPSIWDISVGGHIMYGENEVDALARELKEELGLELKNYRYDKIGVFKEKFVNNNIISFEFVHSFIIYDDVDLNKIVLQREEVEDAKWYTKDEVNNMILNNDIINHIDEYKVLLNDILS